MVKFDVLDLCIFLMRKIGEPFSTGITLFINGSIISGELIHPIAYFKALATFLESAQGDPVSTMVPHALGKMFRDNIGKIKDMPNRLSEESKKIDPEVLYLKNVEVWNLRSCTCPTEKY